MFTTGVDVTNIFIGPKSNHCLPLSLTHSCLVDLMINVAHADEDDRISKVSTLEFLATACRRLV